MRGRGSQRGGDSTDEWRLSRLARSTVAMAAAGSILSATPQSRPLSLGTMSRMDSAAELSRPSGHTPEGGVLIGSDGARRRLVVFEDLQCPYCREFEEVSGDLLRREVASGSVAIEYRIRSFLGLESVRAANALAAAAEAGHFDQLRRELFAHQPAENSGGFTIEDLLERGRRAGLTGHGYATAVREGRYERWVLERERAFREQDPTGTPAAVLDGEPLNSQTLLDPDALGAAVRG